jgi:hypothetical protein
MQRVQGGFRCLEWRVEKKDTFGPWAMEFIEPNIDGISDAGE